VPTYQYACTACDERLEAVQSFTDAPLTQCPACEGTLRKVFSAVGVVFKGSGFYKTDSRSGAKAGAAAEKAGAEGSGDKAASGASASSSSSTAAPAGSSSSSGAGSGGSAAPAAAASKTA